MQFELLSFKRLSSELSLQNQSVEYLEYRETRVQVEYSVIKSQKGVSPINSHFKIELFSQNIVTISIYIIKKPVRV